MAGANYNTRRTRQTGAGRDVVEVAVVNSPQLSTDAEDSSMTSNSGTENNTITENSSTAGSSSSSSSGDDISEKSIETATSASSAISDSGLQKSKDELIKNAQELELQFKDLIKIYQQEKMVFLEKSINLLESGSHPEWEMKMEALKEKRTEALKVAQERRRLRIESILAEYDYAMKNVLDELEAAEREIVDEFTEKRKAQRRLSRSKTGEAGITSNGNSTGNKNNSGNNKEKEGIQDDLSKILNQSKKTKVVTPDSPELTATDEDSKPSEGTDRPSS